MPTALQTLQELDEGRLLATLQNAFHDAAAAVKQHGKAATITVKITVTPVSVNNLIEQPITMDADVIVKLPKDLPKTIFFIDADGNPTRIATQRQTGLAGIGAVDPETGEIKHAQ